jgi:hypothetical protein
LGEIDLVLWSSTLTLLDSQATTPGGQSLEVNCVLMGLSHVECPIPVTKRPIWGAGCPVATLYTVQAVVAIGSDGRA